MERVRAELSESLATHINCTNNCSGGPGWGRTNDQPVTPHPPACPTIPLISNIRVGDDLPDVAVLALEIEPAPSMVVVNLAVPPGARPAPEDYFFVLYALQDGVELFIRR